MVLICPSIDQSSQTSINYICSLLIPSFHFSRVDPSQEKIILICFVLRLRRRLSAVSGFLSSAHLCRAREGRSCTPSTDLSGRRTEGPSCLRGVACRRERKHGTLPVITGECVLGPPRLESRGTTQPRTLDELGEKKRRQPQIRSRNRSFQSLLIRGSPFSRVVASVLRRTGPYRTESSPSRSIDLGPPSARWAFGLLIGQGCLRRLGSRAHGRAVDLRGEGGRGSRGRGEQDGSNTRLRRFTCLQLIAAGDSWPRTKAAIAFM
jgi:hypothetical protein